MTPPALTLALSVGCPCGVGPEVAVRALAGRAASLPADVRVLLVGDAGALHDAARVAGLTLAELPGVSVLAASELPASERRAGAPTPAAGRAQLAAVDRAADLCLAGEADAMVTGPVSKRAITESGFPFLGHTEHLAARAGVGRVVMLFAGPALRTALVTTHVSISALPARVTRDAVRDTVALTAASMAQDFALPRPRVVVAGLNPHAGEGGLLGREEIDVIGPALDDARARCPDAEITGPVPAESAFRQARDGRFDVVVAMYHDQATIASKLLDFGHAVNVTLGLPFVRTSVDHGTAYDIAGRGAADPRGMTAALRLGASMARARRGAVF